VPETKKVDPFKPAQPSIPGVPAPAPVAADVKHSEPHAPGAEFQPVPRKRSIPAAVWTVLGLLIVVVLGGGLLHWSFGAGPKAQPDEPAASAQPDPLAPSPKPAENLPLAPGVIGTTKELAKPWASKRFLFSSVMSASPVPALVVHLPDGQYWGISMIEPFGTCELEYITDPRVLATEYDFRANHPMVGDPCTHTVYDLLQYDGGAPDGGLVRGAIVHGTGVRPPIAIEIVVSGKEIRAVRTE
jgi:hypothetical protein